VNDAELFDAGEHEEGEQDVQKLHRQEEPSQGRPGAPSLRGQGNAVVADEHDARIPR